MASLTEASLAQRREVSEAIKTKVDGALATLTEIWGEVGLSPQQQNKILVTLREEVFVQVDRLVREEEQIRSQYKEEIATSRAKISAICGELGIAVPEVSKVLRVIRHPVGLALALPRPFLVLHLAAVPVVESFVSLLQDTPPQHPSFESSH